MYLKTAFSINFVFELTLCLFALTGSLHGGSGEPTFKKNTASKKEKESLCNTDCVNGSFSITPRYTQLSHTSANNNNVKTSARNI